MKRSHVRLLAWTGALLALGAVFAAYLQPDMMFGLATQIWNCF